MKLDWISGDHLCDPDFHLRRSMFEFQSALNMVNYANYRHTRVDYRHTSDDNILVDHKLNNDTFLSPAKRCGPRRQ